MIGRRRLDTHLLALTQLGAQITFDGTFHMQADQLIGTSILLDEASVTATENAVMASVLARGTTILSNVACEPHVQDLCHFLNSLGGQIEGIGSNMLTIHGVARLHGGEFRIGADFMEVGSFIGAAVVTGSELRILDADPGVLGQIALMFGRLGVAWQTEETICLSRARRIWRLCRILATGFRKSRHSLGRFSLRSAQYCADGCHAVGGCGDVS